MVSLKKILENKEMINRLCQEWGFSAGFDSFPFLYIDPFNVTQNSHLCLLVKTDQNILEKKTEKILDEQQRCSYLSSELSVLLDCHVSVNTENYIQKDRLKTKVSLNSEKADIFKYYGEKGSFKNLNSEEKADIGSFIKPATLNRITLMKHAIAKAKYGEEYSYKDWSPTQFFTNTRPDIMNAQSADMETDEEKVNRSKEVLSYNQEVLRDITQNPSLLESPGSIYFKK